MDIVVKFLKYLVKHQETIIISPIDVKSAIIAGFSQSIVIKEGYEEEEKIKCFFKETFPNFNYLDEKILTKSDNGKTKNGEADLIIDTRKEENDKRPILLFELKRRDDHDSKKKEGEVRDLKNKENALRNSYPDRKIIIVIYFRYDIDNRPSEKYYRANGIIPIYGKDILNTPYFEQNADKIYSTLIDDEKINVCDLINLDNNFSENVDICIKTFKKKFIKKIINLPEEILQIISPYDTGKQFISKLKMMYNAIPDRRSKYKEFEDEQSESLF